MFFCLWAWAFWHRHSENELPHLKQYIKGYCHDARRCKRKRKMNPNIKVNLLNNFKQSNQQKENPPFGVAPSGTLIQLRSCGIKRKQFMPKKIWLNRSSYLRKNGFWTICRSDLAVIERSSCLMTQNKICPGIKSKGSIIVIIIIFKYCEYLMLNNRNHICMLLYKLKLMWMYLWLRQRTQCILFTPEKHWK